MNRRLFLKQLAAVPLVGTGVLLEAPLSLADNTATDRTLIVIFQRGGNDGLNTVVPFGETAYYDLRPTIAVPAPGDGPLPALDLDGFLGLHPSLKPLHDLYLAGDLAIMPAVHYADASRSHSDSQRLIESGSTALEQTGWLNRNLFNQSTQALLAAAGFGDQLPFSLQGEAVVANFSALGTAFNVPGDHDRQMRQALTQVYGQSVAANELNRMLIHQAGLIGLDSLAVIDQIDLAGYIPAYGAQYPDTRFGRHLAQIAQLIKEGVGLEIATAELNGWDTHAGQGGSEENGSHARRLQEFAAGIAALHTDLTDYRSEVLVLTMTEFGRTAKENASGGTDHGNASVWFALGGATRGGIYGEWPGLESEQLHLGRYLAHSIDFRDVMGEVVSRHLGTRDLANVLPGHRYQPIEFLV